MYNCIIFDVDGTLIDTEQALIASLKQVLYEELGAVYEDEKLHLILGIPGRDALMKLEVKEIDTVQAKWNQYLQENAHLTTVFSGIEHVLKTLHERGMAAGIVTSKTRQELIDDFVPFGLSSYVPNAICADDTLRHKPHPEPLLAFIKKYGVDPTKAIYIGDTSYDMEAAHGAGIDFALALWGSKKEISGHVRYQLQSPLDILQLIAPLYPLDGA
ncbi:HAD family hydrolase [Paenibacillus profundus]|uniref:HAD family hydrolase n=1 Tax=Paenibacillus profundus TaxID=1173085 RepID=A0ABS8YIH8_9BACL|nr:HAD family hydrolase [Paenibacillus profundus]MCE5170017.1 HAD family hydrolase [Paenibacillus profundus]